MSVPDEVLLLGSIPVDSTASAFLSASTALGALVKRLPDGETGVRRNFTQFQINKISPKICRASLGGCPASDRATHVVSAADFEPTGYDDVALESYATFCDLRARGLIARGVRFQVCLPTPVCVIGLKCDAAYSVAAEPFYEEQILKSLRRIQDAIPASDLTIQWDMPVDVLFLESERGRLRGTRFEEMLRPYFSDVAGGIAARMRRLAAAVDADVEMGAHLCYGDMGNKHVIEPEDAGVLVQMANLLHDAVLPLHTLAYLHLPVPKDRVDDAYFEPLERMKLPDTKLFLGLVHAEDESGTRRRIERASKAVQRPFGISTECGLGRTSAEKLESIFAISVAVSRS